MLGHVKLSATEIYTSLAINKLKFIHEAIHPARLPDGLAERVQYRDETDPEPTAGDMFDALEREDEDEDEAE